MLTQQLLTKQVFPSAESTTLRGPKVREFNNEFGRSYCATCWISKRCRLYTIHGSPQNRSSYCTGQILTSSYRHEQSYALPSWQVLAGMGRCYEFAQKKSFIERWESSDSSRKTSLELRSYRFGHFGKHGKLLARRITLSRLSCVSDKLSSDMVDPFGIGAGIVGIIRRSSSIGSIWYGLERSAGKIPNHSWQTG